MVPGQRLASLVRSTNDKAEIPSSWLTAKFQFNRLFQRDSNRKVTMTRKERVFRIALSLSLLAISKTVALASPLFFRAIVDSKLSVDESYDILIAKFSMIGLIFGLGVSRVASGVIQLISELILSPATISAAEVHD